MPPVNVRYRSSAAGADENQSGYTHGKGDDLDNPDLLFEQKYTRQSKRYDAAADHHGVTHTAKSVVSHDVHSGIEKSVREKQIEKL